MPKANQGPIEGPILVKVTHRSLPSMLRYIRGTLAFENMGTELVYQEIIAKAEKLEARLNEQQDAIEKAIGLLNEVTPADDGTFTDSDHLQEALAVLNRVL